MKRRNFLAACVAAIAAPLAIFRPRKPKYRSSFLACVSDGRICIYIDGVKTYEGPPGQVINCEGVPIMRGLM